MPVISMVLGTISFPFLSWKYSNNWKLTLLSPSHTHTQDQQNSVIFHWHNSPSVSAICCAGRTHRRSSSIKSGTVTSPCEYSFHFHFTAAPYCLWDWPCISLSLPSTAPLQLLLKKGVGSSEILTSKLPNTKIPTWNWSPFLLAWW